MVKDTLLSKLIKVGWMVMKEHFSGSIPFGTGVTTKVEEVNLVGLKYSKKWLQQNIFSARQLFFYNMKWFKHLDSNQCGHLCLADVAAKSYAGMSLLKSQKRFPAMHSSNRCLSPKFFLRNLHG